MTESPCPGPSDESGGTPVEKPAVLLIVFNRPETTRRVLGRILEFFPSRLYVAADGPRDSVRADRERCAATRALITEMTPAGIEMRTLFRDKNLGCGRAVFESIEWFFSHEESGIILEDDCLPTPDFYAYMSWAIRRFRQDPRIWHVAAMGLPVDDNVPATLVPMPFVWGWASWRKRWSHYRYHIEDDSNRRAQVINSIMPTLEARAYWQSLLDAVNAGKINTWDYQWCYTLWRHQALALVPSVSYVENIGFGPDATHTKSGATVGYADATRGGWRQPSDHWQPREAPRVFKQALENVFGLRMGILAYTVHRLGRLKWLVYIKLGVARRLRDLRAIVSSR